MWLPSPCPLNSKLVNFGSPLQKLSMKVMDNGVCCRRLSANSVACNARINSHFLEALTSSFLLSHHRFPTAFPLIGPPVSCNFFSPNFPLSSTNASCFLRIRVSFPQHFTSLSGSAWIGSLAFLSVRKHPDTALGQILGKCGQPYQSSWTSINQSHSQAFNCRFNCSR